MGSTEFVRKIKADMFNALLPLVIDPVEKTDYDEVIVYLKDVVKNLDENMSLDFNGKVYWK